MFASNVIKLSSLEEAQLWVLRAIVSDGRVANPRGTETTELLNASFSIKNPRSRCIINPARNWSLPLAIGELCWHLSGSDDLSFIAHYAPRWREFSEDGQKVYGSCYGKRIFKQGVTGISQWDQLIELMRRDPMTRRAVLTFHEMPYASLDVESKDVSCATSMQFFIRDDKLHAIVYMRSNDAILGLPYDIFLFTMIQEILSVTLGIELGEYHHIAGSLHLYDHHYELAAKMLETQSESYFEMPVLVDVSEIPIFLVTEQSLRQDSRREYKVQSGYWRELLDVLSLYHSLRVGNIEQAERQTSGRYRDVMQPMLRRYWRQLERR
jgi:thymidylate synthase